GFERLDLGTRHGPHRGLVGAVPADQERAGQRRISELVWVVADASRCFPGIDAAISYEGLEASGDVFGPFSPRAALRKPGDREVGMLAGGYDVGGEPKAPDLHQRRIFPGVGCDALDSGME